MLKYLFTLFLLMTVSCDKYQPMKHNIPSPKKIPYELVAHGYQRIDNYYWLRDDSRSDPEVISYLKEENAYAEAWFKDKQDFKTTIVEELISKLPEQEKSFHFQSGEYKYYTIQYKDKQLPVYLRSTGDNDEIVLDPNIKFKDYDYYNTVSLNPSPDNKLVAFSEDTTGRREYVVKFLDTNNNKLLDDALSLTSGNIVWVDSDTILYLKKDPVTLIANKVFLHRLGTSQTDDRLLYEENDPEFNMNLYESMDKEIAFINIEATNTNEIRYFNKRLNSLNLMLSREENHLYYANYLDQNLYVRSNKGSPNFAVYKTKLDSASNFLNPNNLLVPHDKDVFIENLIPFSNFLALEIRTNGLPEIAVLKNNYKDLEIVQQSEESYSTSLLPSNYQDPEGNLLYEYSSLITPTQILEVDQINVTTSVVWKKEINKYNPEEYETSRKFITARDGIQIPISVVRKKSTADISPILFYGYGSYGINTEASFRRSLLPLLDRGFIFAIINIRGGGEMGKHWYDAGRMQNKMNTFYDFNDGVHAVLNNGIGDKNNVFAQGGSAGGLLMGTIINLEPELYKGILSGVPFVDVLTTMSDPTIPLTTFEYDEWGNPSIKDQYEYMSQYSPYDNIEALSYPAVLVTSSLYDSQVQYFEPAKYVPKLRENTTSNNPILLKMNLVGGHGGKSGIINSFTETAEEYNFLLNLVD